LPLHDPNEHWLYPLETHTCNGSLRCSYPGLSLSFSSYIEKIEIQKTLLEIAQVWNRRCQGEARKTRVGEEAVDLNRILDRATASNVNPAFSHGFDSFQGVPTRSENSANKIKLLRVEGE